MEIAPAHKSALARLADRLRALGFTRIAVESMGAGTALPDDATPCTLYAIRPAGLPVLPGGASGRSDR
jgi:hypothetical protein